MSIEKNTDDEWSKYMYNDVKRNELVNKAVDDIESFTNEINVHN